MSLNQLELSFMAFPQRWNGPGSTLAFNILVLPVGDPRGPLGSGPQFAGSAINLVINIAAGLDSLPSTTTVPDFTQPFVATPPAVAPALFTNLFNQLTAKGIAVTSAPLAKAPANAPQILKALPDSYKLASPFGRSQSDNLRDGKDFHCGLRGQAPNQINPKLPPPDNSIAWGQVISYALRQPVLAQDLGLIYPVTVNIPDGLLASGAFLWATLDTSNPANPWVNDYTSNPDTVKFYAARIPELDSTQNDLPVFAARLFPVVKPPTDPRLTQAQFEAESYSAGFAEIVHGNQPSTVDAATLDQTQIAPGTEAGIQIGWDDEQVTTWLNDQVGLLHDRVTGSNNNAESPLGVLGYRVDVRKKNDANWHSLSLVNGTLPFDTASIGGGAVTSISGNEFWVAPAPVRPSAIDNTTSETPSWLPLYFAQWAGSSLVLPDPVVQLLAFAAAVADPPQPLPAAALPNPNPDLTSVPTLLYGEEYDFRVRLVDLTGGGPFSRDPSPDAGVSPIAEVGFRRFVPPKSLQVVSTPPVPSYPAKPPSVRTIQTLAVQKSRIGYPEAIFAGVSPTTFARPNLDNLIQEAWANNGPISVPDPDVDRFEVRVEARVPTHDTGDAGAQPGDLDGVFRIVYSIEVPFPAGDDPTVTLTLNYIDGVDDIATMTLPVDGTVVLPIPTARDIRVRLFPKAAERPNYYGNDVAKIGLPSDYTVRKESDTEDALFPNDPAEQLEAYYFQPSANILQFLSQQLGLQQGGLTLSGAAGERTIFGASWHLRNLIAADASSITFSNLTELLGQWILVLDLDLERDWTWDGFAAPAITVARGGDNLGTITVPRVVTSNAVGTPGVRPVRAHTRIIFFDAYNPQPVAPAFPREANLNYSVNATLASAGTQQSSYSIRLPITTPPSQVPKIVSTGIAESPFQHSEDYSTTGLRDRYLWIEFEQPIADTADDTYFGRVLAYGPDPLLAASLLPHGTAEDMLQETIEPLLAIDPEPVRRIFSGQSADQSGLDAMTPLVPARLTGPGKSGTFFLLPLPPSVDAEDPALFGFWTYEFRVGHSTMWSTSQGRFGRPLRVSGLQHPAPHLVCSVERGGSAYTKLAGVSVTAPYAVAVNNGNRMYNFAFGDPQTAIWFMLYTQVSQADGASYRNILLDHKLGQPMPPGKENPQHGGPVSPLAYHTFAEANIRHLLSRIGLATNAPLSVLAVEVLPGTLNLSIDQFRGVATPQPRNSNNEDPLGRDLGRRRILRVSTLTAVPATC